MQDCNIQFILIRCGGNARQDSGSPALDLRKVSRVATYFCRVYKIIAVANLARRICRLACPPFAELAALVGMLLAL